MVIEMPLTFAALRGVTFAIFLLKWERMVP